MNSNWMPKGSQNGAKIAQKSNKKSYSFLCRFSEPKNRENERSRESLPFLTELRGGNYRVQMAVGRGVGGRVQLPIPARDLTRSGPVARRIFH